MLTKNKVVDKIEHGGKAIGAFFNLGCTAAAEILAQAGLDFIVIDTEHGPFDVETASELITACEVRGMTPFVRVKDYNRNSVLKMLDVGAMGLLIPFIKTVDEVKELVCYGKYRPVGDRGCGFGRKSGYGMEPLVAGDIRDYFKWANENTLLITQCETVECLENIEEISAVEGVDAIFIGPFDLSVAMGIPKQFDAPEFIAAMDRVLKACKKNGKLCFTLGMNPEDAKKKLDWGFDGVLSGDTTFLISGVSQYLSGIHSLGY